MMRGAWRVHSIGPRWIVMALVLTFAAHSVGTGQPIVLFPRLLRYDIPYSTFLASPTELSIVFGREQVFFVREDELNWQDWDASLIERFSWKTTLTSATSAIYQVSTVRFPTDPAQTMSPPGLVASGSAGSPPGANQRTNFTIDFREFASIPPGERRPGELSPIASPPSVGPLRTIAPRPAPPLRAFHTPASTPQLARESALAMLVTYYVRVATLDAAGKPVGIPSAPVSILYGDITCEDTSANVNYIGAAQFTLAHPSLRVTRYTPIQKEQPGAMYHYVVTQDLYIAGFDVIYAQGDRLDFTPHENDSRFWDTLWNSIGDVFSDIASFARDSVNWVSTAYEDIKKTAIDAAVVVAGEDARGLLTTGLELGLAAMGVPPSLPNYDELTRLGRDYLIEAAADYAGVPPDAARAGVDALLSEAERYANSGGNPQMWLKPDPAYYYRPAYFDVVALNGGTAPTDAVRGVIAVVVPNGSWTANLFHTAYPFIPSIAPGESVTFRVYLEENADFPNPDNPFGGESPYAGMQRFWAAYNSLSATVNVRTAGGPNVTNPSQIQQYAAIRDCRYEQGL